MFLFFKILETLILPPGLFVLLLLASAGILFCLRHRRIALLNLSLGIGLYTLSIFPVSHLLMHGLESPHAIPRTVHGDVIILLGAGLRENVPDLTGTGFPDGDMLGRITTAVRLYNRLDLPILVTSGRVYADSAAGAPVDKRILADLGVDRNQIITEVKSRNTYENARYAAAICREKGFRQPILVTAAYHLSRACYVFQANGLSVTPFPAFRISSDRPAFSWRSCLPHYHSFAISCVAIREYAGTLYYRLRY